ADRTPFTLKVYQGLTAVSVPLADLILKSRLKRGKEHPARWPERRGQTAVARPDGPLVWLHCASVGEFLAILPLIERLDARDITMVLTSGTVTSAGGAAALAVGCDSSVRPDG